MEIKPVNPIDGLETLSQSSLSEDLPADASNTPTPPTVRNSGLNIPDAGSLSSLGGILTILSFRLPIGFFCQKLFFLLYNFFIISINFQNMMEWIKINPKWIGQLLANCYSKIQQSKMCHNEWLNFLYRSSTRWFTLKWRYGNKTGHCWDDTWRRARKFLSSFFLFFVL